MKRLFIFFLSSLLWTGCSIEEEPTSFVNTDNYYLTEAQCISGLNSTYIPLKTIYTYTYLMATEGVSDLMYIASGTLDAQLDISPAQPRFGQNMWTLGYRGVMYCNSIIDGIKRSPLSEDSKNRLLAEGMIMRAYYYWFLTSTFGDVPFYTEDVANAEVLDRVSKLGRMPAVATRDYLIAELQEYLPHLAQVRTNDVPGNRSGAAMGWMLIGKLAQWNKKWDVAKDAMQKLEAIYGDFNKYPLGDIALKNKNILESIFEIQFTYSETGLQVTTNSGAICMPTRSTGAIYDGVEIPELGTNATTWSPLRPNNFFFQSVMRRGSEDLRTNLNMAWDYKGVAFKSTATRPWLGPKFWTYNMYNVADGNNQRVFRYADALLMQAENYMELRDQTAAIKYLNMVRNRAGLADYEFKNWDLLREEIQKERGRELLGEYQRKYDLVRWGIWYQATYDYTDYAALKNNMLPCHEYYPIPDIEVVKSGNNLDNKAYEFYGKG
ncbi:Starch-binding associating with outer membrane [Sphingobacterium nematocida]|uniref:Starch-binding associating with outer membrane n=1 Tax=Sphingobacterium nematocida TaxID=1513896 RepID=A0A1T5CQY6_9SPHI|nr:RagB/SusD family nutrient uptake outer membrane protein [Sphingobacterium nematocida]SKB61753.1 Starch-binding associating with outer membrane [Sphingobacterium nematocida]